MLKENLFQVAKLENVNFGGVAALLFVNVGAESPLTLLTHAENEDFTFPAFAITEWDMYISTPGSETVTGKEIYQFC